MSSTEPPWSIAQSTMTAPGRIERTIASVTTTGARPPGTSTAPMTRSASATARSTARRLLASVMIRPLWIWSTQRSRSRLRSKSRTSASMPCAIHAAFHPTLPAPITTTRARAERRVRHRAARPARRSRARGSASPPAAPSGRRPRSSARAAGARPSRAAPSRTRCPTTSCVEQRVGDLGVRGEVEIGEEHQPRPEVARTPPAAAP